MSSDDVGSSKQFRPIITFLTNVIDQTFAREDRLTKAVANQQVVDHGQIEQLRMRRETAYRALERVLERVVSDLQARQNGEDVKVDICHKDILADSFLAWVFPDCDEGNELRHGFVASMKG